MACFPRLDIRRESGAIVPLADAVQQMHLDLARALLQAKARRSSKKLEQVVSELHRINSQTHSRNSSPIGSRRPQADRLHEGKANSSPSCRDQVSREQVTHIPLEVA